MTTEANVIDPPFFTPAVKPMLLRLGSSDAYSRTKGGSIKTQLGPRETAFVAGRDSFYVAAFGEDHWPYTQRCRGPKGFLRTLDTTILGFASFSDNRRYISTGNALLFLIDHSSGTRLKIWAHAEVSEDLTMTEKLVSWDHSSAMQVAFLFHIRAFSWNYEKHTAQGSARDVQHIELSSKNQCQVSLPPSEKTIRCPESCCAEKIDRHGH